ERLTGKLQRGKRVFYGRGGWIAGDCGDFRLMRLPRRIEDRTEVAIADAREIRQAERPGPVGERIGGKIDHGRLSAGRGSGGKAGCRTGPGALQAARGQAISGFSKSPVSLFIAHNSPVETSNHAPCSVSLPLSSRVL